MLKQQSTQNINTEEEKYWTIIYMCRKEAERNTLWLIQIPSKIPIVVVGFPGCLAVFLRFFFLTFHQSLWPASSEDRSQNSVCALVQFVGWLNIYSGGISFCPFQEIGWLWWSVCFCCESFRLFGRVLKVFLPNVLLISLASIFRGQESELCLCSGSICWIVEYL